MEIGDGCNDSELPLSRTVKTKPNQMKTSIRETDIKSNLMCLFCIKFLQYEFFTYILDCLIQEILDILITAVVRGNSFVFFLCCNTLL